ncbi:hypothetical protein ACH4KN_33830 [Streptomyces sp. NPDC017546]|uniref:hypothetical protein n=1 Tax=Streptomyces sp. NPDC017546 TaxID=3365001 RepID=UPI00378BC24A
MAGELKDGDEVRLIGSGGAPVLLTVGRPFSARDIEARLNSREWRREGGKPPTSAAGPRPRKEKVSKPSDDPGPGPKPRTEKLSKPDDSDADGPQPRTEYRSDPDDEPASGDPRRPSDGAPKTDWVAYVAGLKHMTLEDASSYTKADLIEMAD